MAQKRYLGSIAMYNPNRGFGFIQSDSFSEPLWFHFTFIDGGTKSVLYADLNEREDLHNIRVSFEVDREDLRGGLRARRICPLGPHPDIEDFFRSLVSTEKGARERFLDLASIPALAYIDRDATLTQLAVSRIVRSAKTWDSLTSVARQWSQAVALFQKPLAWTDRDREDLASFTAELARLLKFQLLQDLDYVPALPAIVQPLVGGHIPLRCFREADEVCLVILPNATTLSRIIQRDPSSIATSKSCVKVVILLEEGGSLTDHLEEASRFDIALIRQRTLIETIMSSEEEHPIVIGRNLRAVIPLDRLQPYEVGSAYDEVVFAGRAQERRRILENLDSNHALYGGRKIGKTWFLKDICRWCEEEPYSSMYVPVYVSLQSAENIDDAAVFIQDAISYRLDIPRSEDADVISSLGYDLFVAHKITGKAVLLALDEVDDLLKVDNQYRLFARLRQLQHTYPHAFKFVFAGFKELIDTFSDLATNNPFANWIGNNHFPLGCLTEDDLHSLIVHPLRWVGLDFEPDEIVKKVFELTSGHPYYAQSLCQGIVRTRLKQNAKVLTAQNIEKLASEEFFDEIFDIFIANLSPLQMLIGKVFADREEAFSEADIVEALRSRFGIEITPKRLRKEMKVLQACSVFARYAGGYRPVMQRINQEFFLRQDDVELALRSLEESNGI
ncbi:MAG: hypothetical protein WBW48_20245 [Anaerolineae bacterium]